MRRVKRPVQQPVTSIINDGQACGGSPGSTARKAYVLVGGRLVVPSPQKAGSADSSRSSSRPSYQPLTTRRRPRRPPAPDRFMSVPPTPSRHLRSRTSLRGCHRWRSRPSTAVRPTLVATVLPPVNPDDRAFSSPDAACATALRPTTRRSGDVCLSSSRECCSTSKEPTIYE